MIIACTVVRYFYAEIISSEIIYQKLRRQNEKNKICDNKIIGLGLVRVNSVG